MKNHTAQLAAASVIKNRVK